MSVFQLSTSSWELIGHVPVDLGRGSEIQEEQVSGGGDGEKLRVLSRSRTAIVTPAKCVSQKASPCPQTRR